MKSAIISGVIIIALWIAAIVAWVTHVVYTISNALWVALAIGAFFFPVGIIHGVMIWFGMPAG